VRFDTVDLGAAVLRVPVKGREDVAVQFDVATGRPGFAAGDVDLLFAAPFDPLFRGDLDRLVAAAEAQEILRTGARQPEAAAEGR
jgi:hypothetical protein